MTRQARDYDDIPGTYVFDGEHSRKGYALNMFCMSLNNGDNRDQFKDAPDEYLDRYAMTPEQKQAVVKRDWLRMLQLGGNIYYTFKLAIVDGLTMQDAGAAMSGITRDEFIAMMVAGGRPIEGNRHQSDWETSNG